MVMQNNTTKKHLNKTNMKIWHISDTHTYHGLLDIPEKIDKRQKTKDKRQKKCKLIHFFFIYQISLRSMSYLNMVITYIIRFHI